MEKTNINVFVMHRDYLGAQSLQIALNTLRGISCSGFSDKASVPEGLVDQQIFLIDTHLLVDSAYRFVGVLRAAYPKSRVIALGSPRLLHAVREKGCWSLIDPACSLASIGKYIQQLATASEPFAYQRSDTEPQGLFPVFETLSLRERETLQWLAKGLKNWEIAEEMGISQQTVGTNIARMCEKLGVTRKQELIFLKWRHDGQDQPCLELNL